MAQFRTYFKHAHGQHDEVVVEALSFLDVLEMIHREYAEVIVYRIRMVEDEVTVTLRCAHCLQELDHHIEWGDRNDTIFPCEKCGKSIRLQRERTVVSGTSEASRASQTDRVNGHQPALSVEHTREPTRLDRLRTTIHRPDVIVWNCRSCKWSINCDWQDRERVQSCPECGTNQFVPASAFAWNSRVMREREAEQQAIENARRLAEHEKRQAQEAIRHAEVQEVLRKHQASETARVENERKRQLMMYELAEVAVGAGLITSIEAFNRLSPEDISTIKTYSDIADELHSDFLSALDDNAIAEKGVAYGRPTAVGASIVSLLNGYGWVGLAFGAIAVSARVFANDWKRSQTAEYQAKWTKRFSRCSREEMDAFSAVFAYKYPLLAAKAANGFDSQNAFNSGING
ncbi:MAG: hypothetical protein U0640_13735 [Phycisphaerales bacterium]